MLRPTLVLLLIFTASSLEAATATWDPNSEPDLAGYILSWGTQPGQYTTIVDVGKVTSYQVSLSPGRYYFVVQAYNISLQISPPSNEVVYDSPSAPPATNSPPTLTQPANQTSTANSSVSLQLIASDPDGNALTYSATGLPPGLIVNASTGLISGTLTQAPAGTYFVNATVSDGASTNGKGFTWTVTGASTRARVPTRADVDGDSKADLIVYRPSTSTWWL